MEKGVCGAVPSNIAWRKYLTRTWAFAGELLVGLKKVLVSFYPHLTSYVTVKVDDE